MKVDAPFPPLHRSPDSDEGFPGDRDGDDFYARVARARRRGHFRMEAGEIFADSGRQPRGASGEASPPREIPQKMEKHKARPERSRGWGRADRLLAREKSCVGTGWLIGNGGRCQTGFRPVSPGCTVHVTVCLTKTEIHDSGQKVGSNVGREVVVGSCHLPVRGFFLRFEQRLRDPKQREVLEGGVHPEMPRCSGVDLRSSVQAEDAVYLPPDVDLAEDKKFPRLGVVDGMLADHLSGGNV